MGDRAELSSWPSSNPSAALPNPPHPSVHVMPSLAGYPPGGMAAYSPTVPLPTPPPNLLPSLPPVSGGVNGLNPNFNLSLNINPRLLGSAHMSHPLTSLINSLHGLNNKAAHHPPHPPPTAPPATTTTTSQQQQNEIIINKNQKNNSSSSECEQRKSTAGLKEKVETKSAFHQVTPSLASDENCSKSGSSSPSTTSISPTNSSGTTAPAAIVSQPKTVWRPY